MNKILQEVKEEELNKEVPKVDTDRVPNTDEVIYLDSGTILGLQIKVNELVKEGYFPSNQLIYDGKNYIQCMIHNGLSQDFYQSIVPKG